MKKILLAAVAVLSIGAASSSFAGGCGTPYVTVKKHYVAPTTYVYQQPCQKVIVPAYNPCHIEKKVIIQQPVVHTTYVKPCVQTYKVHTPVYYKPACGYGYGYNYNYSSYYTPSCGY